ncbi:MAG: tol-pal system protein YbgF [Magnetococcales bacterium]|nr:tol-pal system protein YbgF [Magnetococcales bacterium]MBF0115016.1 tol-pal system protein YbgF [Magnetococcales bacterium]
MKTRTTSHPIALQPQPGRRCVQAALSGLLVLTLTGCAGGLGGNKEKPQPEWEKPLLDMDHKVEQTEKSSRAALADLQRRLAAQEAEMRLLRGTQEVLQHENQNLKEQIKEKAVVESDMDRAMPAAQADQSITMPVQPAAGGQTGTKPAPVQTTGAQAVAPLAPQVAQPAQKQPLPPPPSASAGQPQQVAMASKPGTVVASGPPQAMYDAAYQLMRSSQFNASREGFEKFLEKYPDDTLSDNAQYWIGELYLVQKQHREALMAFGKVLTKWPTSSKVPPSLLKIGYAFDELGDYANARASLNKLINDYPDSSAVPQARQRLQEIAQKDAGGAGKSTPAAANAPAHKSESSKQPADPPGSKRAKRLAGD